MNWKPISELTLQEKPGCRGKTSGHLLFLVVFPPSERYKDNEVPLFGFAHEYGQERSYCFVTDRIGGTATHFMKVEKPSSTGEKCGIKRVKQDCDLISGHIEWETTTRCGEDTCSDQCFESWSFCPYCGKPFNKPTEKS